MTQTTDSEKLSEEEVLAALVAEEEAKLTRKHLYSNILWGVAGVMLLGVLVAQYYWFTQRDYVLQHAQIRPWLDTVCAGLSCRLPTTRALQRLHVNKNYMNKHDTADNAVSLHFIFTNQAHFPQPYPGIEIRFEDEKNQLIGLRRLTPQAYVNSNEDVMHLAPKQPVHVNLELQNLVPDMHTFGYAIRFL